MPELPEVECLTRAVKNSSLGWTLSKAEFYRNNLRNKIPVIDFKKHLEGQVIANIRRRSKYMIWEAGEHQAIFHLGMSGNMFSYPSADIRHNHTHAVFELRSNDGKKTHYLHFVDPRRFGLINMCARAEEQNHPLFKKLGPEPLESPELATHLFEQSRKRTICVKSFIMNADVVVGVGNIYASESLFRAGINPLTPAGKVSRSRYDQLARHIQSVLKEAITAGGTSFRDYRATDGSSGYFKVNLAVYGRRDEPCIKCSGKISELRIGGRSSFYCSSCQKK